MMTCTSGETLSPRLLVQTLCLALVCAATALAEGGCDRSAGTAATIFFNGRVIPVQNLVIGGVVEALAVDAQGKIIAVGTRACVEKTYVEGTTTRVDLERKTLMPGFIEPHTHLTQTAIGKHTKVVDLTWFTNPPKDPPTIRSTQERLRRGLAGLVPGQWEVGFGFDPSRTNPFMKDLDATILDEVQAPTPVKDQVPIFVVNQSGHIAYVNTRAIQLACAGNACPPDLKGGTFVRDQDGNMTGVLFEAPAFHPFMDKIEKASPKGPEADAQMLEAVRLTYWDFARRGVTTATELTIGATLGYGEKTPIELGLLDSIAKDKPPLRVRGYYDGATFPPQWTLPSPPLPLVQPAGVKPELFRIIGIKFIGDGSTQGLTAAVNEPYNYKSPDPSNTENKGELNYVPTRENPHPLLDAVRPWFEKGWQVAIHSNGDRTLDQVLGIYTSLLKNDGSNPQRLRIDHLTVTNDRQLDTIAEYGITPSMTMGHPYYWGCSFAGGPCLVKTLGADNDKVNILGLPGDQENVRLARARRIDPAGSLVRAGERRKRPIRFSFHSDSPVSPVDPLRYVTTAVTRLWQFLPQEVLSPCSKCPQDERISVDQAIRAVTIDAAYQLFLDQQVGSLEAGKWADLVILKENPWEVAPDKIADIEVVGTYLAGRCVWGPWAGCGIAPRHP